MQLGFAAALLGEGITGKGILGQFDIEVCRGCCMIFQRLHHISALQWVSMVGLHDAQ